jgi:hypothetical protein
MAPPKPTQPAARPTPETPEPRPHPGDAHELAEALSNCDVLEDWDVAGVRQTSGAGSQFGFRVDDGDWEYQIKVTRIRQSMSN